MKHPLILVIAGCAFLAGCAASEQNHQQERMLEMNERRIDSVEKNITTLNEQIAMLNNRVYEVRGYKGRKTGMTVVPVTPPQTLAAPGQQAPAQPVAAGQPDPAQQHKIAQYNSQPVASAQPVAAPHQQNAQKAKQAKKKEADKKVKNAGKAQHHTQEVASLPPQSASGALTLPPAERNSPQMVQAQEQGVLGLPPTLPMDSQSPALPQEQATVRTASNQPSYQSSNQPASHAQSRAPVAQRAAAGEEASYRQALQLVRKGRSQEGIQKFNEYLSRYPNGKYAPNAEYWIGECYYSQGRYREALGKYESVNSKYPSHHKNADALLKSGMTYSRLGDNSNAQAKYSQLQQNFPQSEAARRARSGR